MNEAGLDPGIDHMLAMVCDFYLRSVIKNYGEVANKPLRKIPHKYIIYFLYVLLLPFTLDIFLNLKINYY